MLHPTDQQVIDQQVIDVQLPNTSLYQTPRFIDKLRRVQPATSDCLDRAPSTPPFQFNSSRVTSRQQDAGEAVVNDQRSHYRLFTFRMGPKFVYPGLRCNAMLVATRLLSAGTITVIGRP